MDNLSSPESEGEEKLSPQALNAQLRQLYKSLPKNDLSVSQEEWDAATERRINSEYQERIQKRVKDLISQAHITSSFRDWIIGQFEFAGWGTLDDDYDKGKVFFLDFSDESSGGIFDPERAKELDRTGYMKKAGEIATEDQAVQRAGHTGASFWQSRKERNIQALQKWRDQYHQTYGEDLLRK